MKAPRRKAPQNLLLDSYRPIEGVLDEMVDDVGRLRPAWKKFVAALEDVGPEELKERFTRADQYLRDAGVYYRVYDRSGANEREWPLAHVPLLVDEAEWAGISAGLTQRAELFEAISAAYMARTSWSRTACCRPA